MSFKVLVNSSTGFDEIGRWTVIVSRIISFTTNVKWSRSKSGGEGVDGEQENNLRKKSLECPKKGFWETLQPKVSVTMNHMNVEQSRNITILKNQKKT